MDSNSFASGVAQLTGQINPAFDAVELAGGASNRRYFRIHAGNQRWVVMVLAEEPLRSEEASSGPVPTELPFLEIQQFLHQRGVPVPAVYHFDKEQGLLWIDDLGDTTLLALLDQKPEQSTAGYKAAIDILIEFQRATVGQRTRPICYQREFEASLLKWELEHYLEWRIETQLERVLTAQEKSHFSSTFDGLVRQVDSLPKIICHRDFQSTNLMVTSDTSESPIQLVLNDYQDALVGSYCYDLVALLRDSYVALSPENLDDLIDYYLSQRKDLDPVAFRRAFDLQTVQRKLKDAGRFVYIDRVKHDPSYLRWIDPTLGYVRQALNRQPELAELRHLLETFDPLAFA